MKIVDVLQAETSLSQLVEAVATSCEREIILTHNGRPAARLVPLGRPSVKPRIGVAKGKFVIPDDIDGHNSEVSQLFNS